MDITTISMDPNTWVKGEQKDYKMFVLEVSVLQDNKGRVFSSHRFQNESDNALAHSLPSCGLEQIAHALLLEAIRRETYLDVILKMQDQPNLLKAYMSGTDTDKEAMALELSQHMEEILKRLITKISPSVSVELLKDLSERESLREATSADEKA